jgi:hypothetical protein
MTSSTMFELMGHTVSQPFRYLLGEGRSLWLQLEAAIRVGLRRAIHPAAQPGDHEVRHESAHVLAHNGARHAQRHGSVLRETVHAEQELSGAFVGRLQPSHPDPKACHPMRQQRPAVAIWLGHSAVVPSPTTSKGLG